MRRANPSVIMIMIAGLRRQSVCSFKWLAASGMMEKIQ